MVQKMGIDSLRAEITLFEAAKAHAMADGRDRATPADIRSVAPMTLRLRRSAFMKDFFSSQAREEKELTRLLAGSRTTSPKTALGKKSRR